MRRKGHKTSGLKFDPKFDFSVTISYMAKNYGNWTTTSCILANFLLHMFRNGQLFPVKFVTPSLKSPLAVSYSSTNFGGVSAKIYRCFEQKLAFVMQNFRHLGASGVGIEMF